MKWFAACRAVATELPVARTGAQIACENPGGRPAIPSDEPLPGPAVPRRGSIGR